ncbi:MAG: F420-dependent NADP oxidoreductase [Bacteroidales bacterium]
MKELTIIGSGRVAEALALAFYMSGHTIGSIISRNRKTAEELANKTGSKVQSDMVIQDSSDVVILAVPDDAISSIIGQLKLPPSIVVVHTSGSTGTEVFPASMPHHGVIYPLQTFTSNRQVNIAEIPFFTEASDVKTHEFIDGLVHTLGVQTYHIDSARRKMLHLSAVFVCNFVNHMLFAGISIAEKSQIERSVFGPLVRETIQKSLDMGPAEAQTGPAARNDISTIEKHIGLLSYSEELMNLYRVVSDSITKHTTNNSG